MGLVFIQVVFNFPELVSGQQYLLDLKLGIHSRNIERQSFSFPVQMRGTYSPSTRPEAEGLCHFLSSSSSKYPESSIVYAVIVLPRPGSRLKCREQSSHL